MKRDLFRDNLWQFVSVIVAALGLFFNAIAFQDPTTRLIGIIIVLALVIAVIFLLKVIPPEQKQAPNNIQSTPLSSPPATTSGSQSNNTALPPLPPLPLKKDSQATVAPTAPAQQLQKDLLEEGHRHYSKKHWKAAETAYRKARELNPDESLPYYYVGNIFYRNEKYREAYACYEKALRLDRFLAVAYYGKGMALENLGYAKEAMDAYRQGTTHYHDIDPTIETHMNYKLIRIYYRIRSLAGITFLIAVILIGILATVLNLKDSFQNAIFTLLVILAVAIFVAGWLFTWATRKYLRIYIPESKTNTSQTA